MKSSPEDRPRRSEPEQSGYFLDPERSKKHRSRPPLLPPILFTHLKADLHLHRNPFPGTNPAREYHARSFRFSGNGIFTNAAELNASANKFPSSLAANRPSNTENDRNSLFAPLPQAARAVSSRGALKPGKRKLSGFGGVVCGVLWGGHVAVEFT